MVKYISVKNRTAVANKILERVLILALGFAFILGGAAVMVESDCVFLKFVVFNIILALRVC